MNITRNQNNLRYIITRAAPLILIFGGFAARVTAIGVDSLHEDEAVYAYWARLIASGRDPLLLNVLVDKPPVFLYVLAAVFRYVGTTEILARFVNVLFSTITVAVCYALVREMYDADTALVAATFMALSPFNILFAPTVFIDPLLVLFVLAALWAVALRRDFVAGVLIGLAAATKQHGWLFVPLVLGMQWARNRLGAWHFPPTGINFSATHLILGIAMVMAPTVWWDAQRWTLRPSYFEQSARTYGELAWAGYAEPLEANDKWRERYDDWRRLLSYITASPILNWGLVVALPVWLWQCRSDLRGFTLSGSPYRVQASLEPRRSRRKKIYDVVWIGFSAGLVAFYFFGQFNTWDRYLLGIVPITAITTARVSLSLRGWWKRAVYPLIAAAVLAVLLLPGAYRAVRRDLPIGGDHWAYRGIDHAVTYLREHVPAGAIVYHNQLGWHLSYYLFDANYDLRAYTNALEVVDNYVTDHQYPAPAYVLVATARPAASLFAHAQTQGLTMTLLARIRRGDGSLAFVVYELQAARD